MRHPEHYWNKFVGIARAPRPLPSLWVAWPGIQHGASAVTITYKAARTLDDTSF
jgi:hypothetical protein